MRKGVLVVLALAGCAKEGYWVRQGASQEDFYRDRGACVAQASSVPFAPAMQVAAVFSGCMQGKGWYWQEQ